MPVKHPLWHLILYISKSCKFLIETMPGGAALFDYNNDGLLDIFLVNGGKITDTLKVPEQFDRSNPRYWNRLYRQNRDGTFTDVTQKAGVSAGGWSVSAGFFDFDNDGHLDLFVTRYMEWNADHNNICGGDWHTYCPPAEFPPTTCILYRNRGDGTFENVSESSGITAKKGRALGAAFADYDADGNTDIFVANDGMQQYLYHNNGNGTFTECALESGAALTADGKGLSGMGTVFQDYDNDGRPDILVTVLPRELYGLYHNDGGGSFSYQSLETGLGALTSGSSGWGVGLEDFDNDGWMDALITTLGGPPVLLLNRGTNGNHWLSITLRGTRSNRDGYGARVDVNGRTRFASSAGSYVCANDKRLHFGLGDSQIVTVDVSWPSGAQQKLKDVHANQFLEIREPEHS